MLSGSTFSLQTTQRGRAGRQKTVESAAREPREACLGAERAPILPHRSPLSYSTSRKFSPLLRTVAGLHTQRPEGEEGAESSSSVVLWASPDATASEPCQMLISHQIDNEGSLNQRHGVHDKPGRARGRQHKVQNVASSALSQLTSRRQSIPSCSKKTAHS